MQFTSVTFLYLFLPIALTVYFLAPVKARGGVLLALSAAFYFIAEPFWGALLIFSALSAYFFGLGIAFFKNNRAAEALLITFIAINAAALILFKCAAAAGPIKSFFGSSLPFTGFIPPVGVSFYTLQAISYVTDVYRGDILPERGLFTFGRFFCFFPKLAAGPLVRYGEFKFNEVSGRPSLENAASGMSRFSVGLSKKLLLADTLAVLCETFRASTEKSVLFYWIWAAAFTLRIYYDFSGYTDMAIGLGRVFGYRLPENFNYPFTARSVTEFIGRWHITLYRWFADYIYRPLTGKSASAVRNIFAIFAVCALYGLWHGFSLNFAAAGVWFGLLIIFEKFIFINILKKLPSAPRRIYTVITVMVGFVLFGSGGFSAILSVLGGLTGVGGLPFLNSETLYYLRSSAFILLICAIGATPLCRDLYNRFAATRFGRRAALILEPLFVVALIITSTAFLTGGDPVPFVFYRF